VKATPDPEAPPAFHRGGSGKSGGQRQNLATTCLAAALRYQLGGDDHGLPQYAPVVLDEAFDKADNEFTALANERFRQLWVSDDRGDASQICHDAGAIHRRRMFRGHVNCRDEATTRHGAQRFFEWLSQTGEEAHVAGIRRDSRSSSIQVTVGHSAKFFGLQ
jgi:putative exonuclease SbcCD C subunit